MSVLKPQDGTVLTRHRERVLLEEAYQFVTKMLEVEYLALRPHATVTGMRAAIKNALDELPREFISKDFMLEEL